MPEVRLQTSRVVAFVRQRKTTGVSQHVRVNLELEARSRSCPLEHPGEASSRERRATLRYKHERTGRRLTLQPAQGAQLEAREWMGAGRPSLDPADGQDGRGEIDLIPQRRSQSSAARSPWRNASRVIVASRCPYRLAFAASIN